MYRMESQPSMYPAQVRVKPADSKYQAANRLWQGIPGLERTSSGWLYVNFYTGMRTEESGNFIVLIRGREEWPMESWQDAMLVVEHPHPEVRCYDPCLWMDPLGRLWMTWTQSRGYFDGRCGVWAIRCDDPEAQDPVWSSPKRIANGLMMNKPIVTDDGTWLFPCAIWTEQFEKPLEAHPELAHEVGSNVYASHDNGETFTFLGGADMPGRAFDEHMAVQLADRRLWMLIRTRVGIGESYSCDGGKTWSPGVDSGISGPNSRFFVRRLRSGRLLMINHFSFRYPGRDARGFTRRSNLIAQLSEDDGRSWIGALVLDSRSDVSYPDGIEDSGGRIRIVYDRERYNAREILMASFREEDILEGMLVTEGSYLRRVISKAEGSRE